MPITKSALTLVAEATAEITTYSVDQVRARLASDPKLQIVDIRDVRELEREGTVPGALLAPRGMLEFWVDPESPYHREVFASGNKMVFYCAAAWRSALATKTVQDMGLANVAHIEGGFTAWKEAGLPVVERDKKGKH